MTIRVMGVDPGLTRCGLSVADGGRGRAVTPIAVGVARTPSDIELPDRLLRLSNAAEEWMDRYDPDVVAIERIFERGNVSDKAQMTTMVTRILGLSEPPKPADAADALALAICHCWRAPLLARAKEALQ